MQNRNELFELLKPDIVKLIRSLLTDGRAVDVDIRRRGECGCAAEIGVLQRQIDTINESGGGGGGGGATQMTVAGDNIAAAGNAGDDFTSESVTYTLTNTGSVSIDWTITKFRSWVTLSAASGTLAVGDSTTVDVSLNSGASSLTSGDYSDILVFNANDATMAVNIVSLSIAASPTLEDYIKAVTAPVSTTGSTVTLTMPTVEDDQQVVAFLRLEGIDLTITDTDSFSNTTGGVYDYWSSDSPPSGTTGVTLVSLMRYASATDSGDSFSIDVANSDSSPFAGASTVIIVVLRANPLVSYVDFYNGVQWEPSSYQSMELDLTHYNNLVLFAAVGYTDGSLVFNTFPTEVSSTPNMYIGAKIYPVPKYFGITEISTITSVPCFVSEALWMYSLTATA